MNVEFATVIIHLVRIAVVSQMVMVHLVVENVALAVKVYLMVPVIVMVMF